MAGGYEKGRRKDLGRGVIHHHMSEMISRDQYIHNKRYYIFNLSRGSKKIRKSKFPRPLQGKTGLLYFFFYFSFRLKKKKSDVEFIYPRFAHAETWKTNPETSIKLSDSVKTCT